jgi:acetyl esterase/lipase
MRLVKSLTVLAFVVFFVGCKKSDSTSGGSGFITVSAKNYYNVAYGTDARQTMDIYLPANRRADSTRILVLIHGGSWVGGDKTDFNIYIDTLKNRFPNYGIFNINYRLSSGGTVNTFPTQEMDVQTAVRFIYGNATNEYQVNNQKVVLLGTSAGGHLAMLQGFKDSIPVKPKAIVSFFGPSDLMDMYFNPVGNNPLLAYGLALAVGKTPLQDAAIYLSSSPSNYLNGGSPPTILLHGGLDPLVRPTQSQNINAALTFLNVPSQYVYYPTGGHADWSTSMYTDAFNKIQAFLAANVH